jgi:hypothetical protein
MTQHKDKQDMKDASQVSLHSSVKSSSIIIIAENGVTAHTHTHTLSLYGMDTSELIL